MNISLFPFAHDNLVSRDGFGRPIPREPAHLHTQAESGAYSRDSSRFPRRRPCIYTANRHRVSPEFYQVTQLRTDGFRCQESAGTGHRASINTVVLEVVIPVPVLPFQVHSTMDQVVCASLFPYPVLVCNGHV